MRRPFFLSEFRLAGFRLSDLQAWTVSLEQACRMLQQLAVCSRERDDLGLAGIGNKAVLVSLDL